MRHLHRFILSEYHDYETLTQVYSVGIKNIIQNFILCYENIMFVLHNKQDI